LASVPERWCAFEDFYGKRPTWEYAHYYGPDPSPPTGASRIECVREDGKPWGWMTAYGGLVRILRAEDMWA
jgi:hypothetical protein